MTVWGKSTFVMSLANRLSGNETNSVAVFISLHNFSERSQNYAQEGCHLTLLTEHILR